MLKELKNSDIDTIMDLWKEEFFKNNKTKKDNTLITQYIDVQNQLLNKKNTTILYTEDGEIHGFVSVNENNEIWLIFVKANIRREGIGSILLEYSKKKFKKLYVKLSNKNKDIIEFFYKNGFYKIEMEEKDKSECLLEWNNKQKELTNLIYFDEDIDKTVLRKDSKINLVNIEVKNLLQKENLELNDIKTYILLRKKIEDGFKADKIILYIDYNNYYDILDELIKEIVKIEKVNFSVVICEPFSMESTKKNKIEKIEKNYKKYKVHKIDCTLDMNENISINQIFKKRMEILLQEIENIAENM